MATFTTSWYSYGSGGQYRLRLVITDPPSVGSGTSSVSLTAQLYVETSSSLFDSNNENRIAGDLGSASAASVNVSHGSGGGQTLVRSRTGTISTSFNGTVSVTVSGFIEGYEALTNRSISGTVTVPRRPYYAPNAATSVDASRTGTSSVRVTWSRSATSSRPVHEQRVQRWSSASGSWSTVHTIGTNYTSSGSHTWTDTAASNGTAWRYRIVTVNSTSSVTSAQTALLPAVPTAPTTVLVTRTSDTSHSVGWQRTASTNRPYHDQRVQRRVWSAGAWGSWTTIATLTTDYTTAGANSYVDATTVANRAYQWRVVSENSAGTATSAESATAYTTPAAPSGVSAAKSGTDIVVSWTNTAGHPAYNTYIEHSEDGGAYTALATVPYTATSYIHDDPDPAHTHRYRLRAQNITGGLASSTVQSAVVQLAAPPAAPTPFGPTSAQDASGPVQFGWVYNSIDSSPQTRFQLRHRSAGGVTWVVETAVEQSAPYTILSPSLEYWWGYANGDDIEWSVRTWGQHADPSPWSSTATLRLSSRPLATIVVPESNAPWTTSSMTVQWSYYDQEGDSQDGWRVRLYSSSGAVLETREGTGAQTSRALSTVLANEQEYQVGVQVRDSTGRWSNEVRTTFSVDYDPPPTPVLDALVDEDTMSVVLTVTNPDPGAGEVEAVHNNVYRYVGDGRFEVLAAGLAVNGTVTDPLPVYGPGTKNVYVVEAVSITPSSAMSVLETVVVEPEGCDQWMWFNAGPAFALRARLRGDPSVAVVHSRAKVLRQFVGRTDPVEYASPAKTHGLTAAGSIENVELNTEADFAAVVDAAAPVVYRDFWGRKEFVSTGELTLTQTHARMATVSLPMTRVEHIIDTVRIQITIRLDEVGSNLYESRSTSAEQADDLVLAGTGLYEVRDASLTERIVSLARTGERLYEVVVWE